MRNVRVTSHRRLKARDHCIPRYLIGRKGQDHICSLHTRSAPVSQEFQAKTRLVEATNGPADKMGKQFKKKMPQVRII